MTRVKICGLTRPEDVRLACELGASALGFVFASGSPRCVSRDWAKELSAAAAPGVTRVGVFVDEESTFICETVAAARLDLAQIHRPLRAEDFEEVSVPVVAVVSVSGAELRLPPSDLLTRCLWVLFDAGGSDRVGGTGRRFDWNVLAGKAFDVPVYLAGGLDADNVGEAVERVRPDGVDVASGVEGGPGVKDPKKMKRFFEAVREADARISRETEGGGREADAKT